MTRKGATSSHRDTLSGHEEAQDRKQGHEGGYVSIQQAAQRCGVSDKTIQRAIRAGTLPARYPKQNRCEIAVNDLDTFLSGHVQAGATQRLAQHVPGHVQTEMEQRVAALEQRIGQLEHLVAELLGKPAVPKQRSKAKMREHTTGPLPKYYVSLLGFAQHHNVSESTVQIHVDMGVLPVKRGTWTNANGMEVTVALDAKGRAAFYQLYRGDVIHFAPCLHCPHGYQDSMSGQG